MYQYCFQSHFNFPAWAHVLYDLYGRTAEL